MKHRIESIICVALLERLGQHPRQPGRHAARRSRRLQQRRGNGAHQLL